MITVESLQDIFSQKLSSYKFPEEPATLYRPVDYILSLGGKRIRPVLVMAAYNLYKEDVDYAFEAGMAIEVFHNFSLLHDDIMDEADIRRGKPTVHTLYDENTAILSGDVMLIYAYRFLEKYPEQLVELTRLFTNTSIEVCEGQRMDMDFEVSDEVSIQDYLRMIELKTSVAIAASLAMGGVLAGADDDDKKHLYEFGRNMGIAFQIQDDLLDTFGTEALVGKKIGGDILQRKKTYLYLQSLKLLSKTEADELRAIYSDYSGAEIDVDRVKALFRAAHVDVHAQELKLVYKQLSDSHLAAVKVDASRKKILSDLSEKLLNRTL